MNVNNQCTHTHTKNTHTQKKTHTHTHTAHTAGRLSIFSLRRRDFGHPKTTRGSLYSVARPSPEMWDFWRNYTQTE